MGMPVFQTYAAELAALGPEVYRAVEPASLAEHEVPVTPALAALAFVSSAQPYWDAHSVVIGYMLEVAGPERSADDLARFLGRHVDLAQWLTDRAVREYAEQTRLETPQPVLARAAQIIDTALDRDAYRSAQLTSTRILYCRQHCGEDLACFRECLGP
jgi:hypothetical protein